MRIIRVRIIINVRRRRGVAARKSKTECPGSRDQDGGLSKSTLRQSNRQPANRHRNQENRFHKYSILTSCFFVFLRGTGTSARNLLGVDPFPPSQDRIRAAVRFPYTRDSLTDSRSG